MKTTNFIASALCVFVLFNFTACDVLQKAAQSVEGLNAQKPVTENEVIGGLKQALEMGIGNGANAVSQTDGYFKNPKIKIPFPPEVQKVANTLRTMGLGKEVDKVVLSLNRAAEDAAKSAKPIFVKAIKSMTIKDAWNILKGEKNAATMYLKDKTWKDLFNVFKPVVKKSLDKVAATKHWNKVITQYNALPLVKKVNPNLDEYVTNKALDGLFIVVEDEEGKIRANPIKRTTELLKRVFRLQDR